MMSETLQARDGHSLGKQVTNGCCQKVVLYEKGVGVMVQETHETSERKVLNHLTSKLD